MNTPTRSAPRSLPVGPAHAKDLLGQVLMERYALEQVIGRGGMAVVYRARDQRLLRDVCVKVFMGWNPALPAYRAVHQHFVQEAFALSQLNHPNIIRIYDFGNLEQEPHSPFFVSEFLEDGTLREYVSQRHGLPPEEALEILQPVCSALTEAHQRGLIHRDIKPSNILFGRAGTLRLVKLADFGIAKAVDDESSADLPHRADDTNALAQGIHMYSASWCAPEQLVGEVAGPPTDGFALGLLAIYMLTGKRMLSSSLTQCLQSRMEGDAFFERELPLLNLPPPLCTVLLRACRMDIKERYPTAEAFSRAFAEAVRASQMITDPSIELLDDAKGEGGKGLGELPAMATEVASRPQDQRPEEPPVFMLDSLHPSALLQARIPVRPLALSDSLEIGAPQHRLPIDARVRLSWVAEGNGALRLHLKGLSCFLQRPGQRACTALDLRSDAQIDLISVDRKQRGSLHFYLGFGESDGRRFVTADRGVFWLPTSVMPRPAVLISIGASSPLLMLYPLAPAGTP